jgi:hypothetical protein
VSLESVEDEEDEEDPYPLGRGDKEYFATHIG